MSTASIIESAASATRGNEFEFYGPPKASGPLVEKSSLFTVRHDGKVATPGATIKAHFPAIQLSPFGARKRLAHRQTLGRLQAVRAAIECGYGKRGEWASSLALNRDASRQLSRYMLARLELAAACVQQDANQAYYPREFSRVLEKSETGMLAFTLGSMGTYLAARHWLKSGGVSLSTFLHYDIWSKARVSPRAGGVKGKQPDFLVADSAGNWHVFESKGGRGQNRWARLAEGLQQLSNVTQVGWAGKPLARPQSKACVHTSVDPGEPLKVVLVDPVESSASPEEATWCSVIESMSKLMVALDTLDLYEVLTGGEIRGDASLGDGWVAGESSAFGGIYLRLPSRLIQQAAQARRYINLLLWVREHVEARRAFGQDPDGNLLARALLTETLGKEPPEERQSASVRRWYFQAQQALVEVEDGANFLLDLNSRLETNWLANALVPSSKEWDEERDDARMVVTTAGLQIMSLPES